MKKYSQYRAIIALSRGAFKAILRSPSTVVFSLAFPLIFILGFVFLGQKKQLQLPVGFLAKDTSSLFFAQIKNIAEIEPIIQDVTLLKDKLSKEKIIAYISIEQDSTVSITYAKNANSNEGKLLTLLINDYFSTSPIAKNTHIKIEKKSLPTPTNEYKTIDFILPGQVGFALLGASIFGTAFLFFSLRQELVLKRFFATPISKLSILLGESIARIFFQLLAMFIVIAIGIVFFDFTIVHLFSGLIQVTVLAIISLVVFMGYGYVVSGIAKNTATIPALSNLFAMPQFLLSGVFFSIEDFPLWLQPICKALPLTHFNIAMRKICFEGENLIDCSNHIMVIVLWGIVIYLLAIKLFKWE